MSEYENYEVRNNRKNKKKHSFLKRVICIVLAGALFGGVAGGTAYFVNYQLTEYYSSTAEASDTTEEAETISDITTTTTTTTTTSSSNSDVTTIAKEGLKCVVSVTNISVQEVQNYMGMYGRGGMGFGSTQTTQTTSVGSGVIIKAGDEYLYIITNYHVVEDATTLSVTFADDATYEASLVGYDEDSDIAVMKVAISDLSETTLSSISVATIGDSDELVVGEQVVAIGNALGYGQSVTSGIVSAVNREITTDTTTNTYIQTDAAINSGNSGGALFNMDGELIGINTAKISSTGVEGMGYAIPISQVIDFVYSLINE